MFFFQAEDGIRDIGVTGVQTCALPIWAALLVRRSGGRWGRSERRDRRGGPRLRPQRTGGLRGDDLRERTWLGCDHDAARSGERRVGKEGRSRWAPDQ